LKLFKFCCTALLIGIQLVNPVYANDDIVKIMTLNIGHARADGASQLLQNDDQARSHLWRIIDVIKREKPDVAAFQEIDRNSFWNGRFDHGEFVRERAGYPHYFSGSHVQSGLLDYGTALMARVELEQPTSIQFTKPFARPRKGFVLSTINWPGGRDISVDLVSVHFDFLTGSKRREEADQLIATLMPRSNPRVIMGDLNSEYDNALIPWMEEQLGLYTWQPLNEDVTFPKLNKRLDWVLVSPEIEILRHEVLSDSLSDHRAVIAELRLTES
jgi:endonuclease/exonuclease/phosphatase family metal-dependent hydrolase